jgi:hypothetical protein
VTWNAEREYCVRTGLEREEGKGEIEEKYTVKEYK